MSDWDFWASAMAGEKPETTPGTPHQGFYRNKRDAIAIWQSDDTGEWLCLLNGKQFSRPIDEIDALFARCCRTPISHEVYLEAVSSGNWPDDIDPPTERGIGDNSASLADHERVLAEITDLKDRARDWLNSIGGEIANKTDADKAGNYAKEFADLEKKATETHKANKAPILEQGRAIDAAWKPVIETADAAKRHMKKIVEPYLLAEKRRVDDENRKAAEAHRAEVERHRQETERAAAANAPAPLPPMAPVVAKATVGRGNIAIRTRQVHEITDLPALLAYFAGMADPPPDLIDACQKIANRMRIAGVTVPGVTTRTVEQAA